MIIAIEDKNGNDIGQVHIKEGVFGGSQILGIKGNISIADIDFDAYFNTNEDRIRIQLEESV